MPRRVAPALLLLLLLASATVLGCSAEPEPPALTESQRESAFFEAYQQRLGMERNYADPMAARSATVNLGNVVCDELANGVDPGVIRGSLGPSPDEARVQYDTAVEFLCPEQGQG